jgi:hypothetical protein
MFRTLKNELTDFLTDNRFYYELSGASGCYHFEILTDENGVKQINSFLNSVCITEEA